MSSSARVSPTIFREYIGVKPYPDNLDGFPTQIINPGIQEFHFILGFAREDGNGNFNTAWNVEYFSAERVLQLKTNSKVKVVISIGGRGPEYPFNPVATEMWIYNATNSVRAVIKDYKERCGGHDIIDGIDINYEEVNSSEADFAHCIGTLITNVRALEPNIKVVSIAPSRLANTHYKRFYEVYRNHIDWVDYHFYNQNVPTKVVFIEQFEALQRDYDAHKLLAGYSTDSSGAHQMKQEVFIEGCKDLVKRKLLAGVFIWNAHDSMVRMTNGEPFYLEEMMQGILTNPN